MADFWNIPIQYQSGTYGVSEFVENSEERISIDYAEYGKIVTCTIPDGEECRELILYGIPKEELEETLRAVYDDSGRLKKIAMDMENKEKLLYIYYEDAQEAGEEIKNFAVRTADAMAEEIVRCEEEVSRLFIEYFEDGEAMDYHAKIGTAAQKAALEEKYPEYSDIGDSCGDYPGGLIKGDNDGLAIRVKCADYEEEDFFRFAVEIMTERIKEKVSGRLKQAEDFEFLCMEYD